MRKSAFEIKNLPEIKKTDRQLIISNKFFHTVFEKLASFVGPPRALLFFSKIRDKFLRKIGENWKNGRNLLSYQNVRKIRKFLQTIVPVKRYTVIPKLQHHPGFSR